MSQSAWVTLATNDSYALGALVVAHTLKRVKTVHQLAILITPGVSESMRGKLQTVFNVVQEVNVLDSQDASNLAMLKRPELGITFTKLHCWRLTQFQKCVFLDADTLVLQNCDELFDREELSAAPDVGWPDCFNSGVFVFKPSQDTFTKLTQFAAEKGSFDGGDQGLLNLYFSDWATQDSSRRLPFVYNTCSTACYSYLPAFKQFGENVKILHFIGKLKPWLITFDPCSKRANPPAEQGHLSEYLAHWWNVFCDDVHPKLSTDMTSDEQLHFGTTRWYEISSQIRNHHPSPQIDFHSDVQSTIHHHAPHHTNSSFFDPWEEYYKKQSVRDIENHSLGNANDRQQDNVESSSEYRHNHEQTHFEQEAQQQPVEVQAIVNNIRHAHDTYHDHHHHHHHHQHQQHHQHYHQDSRHQNHQSVQNHHQHHSHSHKYESSSPPRHHSPVLSPSQHIRTRSPSPVPKSSPSSFVSDPKSESSIAPTEESGLAGALAHLTLGAPRSAEQQAYEDSCRRNCWEHGNIDYLGKDSFDNIWKRITQTLDSAAETQRRERTPTPQPEDKLPVESKKEARIGPIIYESDEDDYIITETYLIQGKVGEEARKAAGITEQIVNEVLADGRVVQRKIITYPGEETEEVEEWETTEVGDGKTETHRRAGGEKKPVVKTVQLKTPLQAPPSRSEVVIVPGHTKVDYDPITGAKIVTEKTTTGSQQTITTTLPDGRITIQVKTFFDAVETEETVEEEEETWEETEVVEPGVKTTTTTLTGSVEKCEQQKAVCEKQHALATKTTETSSVESVKKQQQSSQVTKKTQETVTSSKQESSHVVKQEESQLQVAVSEPTIKTVKKTLASGDEVEVQTVVSADGKTTSKRKVVNKPGEEIEIEETEETTTYEPAEVKVTTTSKTYPVEKQTQAITEEQVTSKNTKQTKQEAHEQTKQVQSTQKQTSQQKSQQTSQQTSHQTSSNQSVVQQSNLQNQQATVFSTSSSKKTSSAEQTVSITKDGVTATATQSEKKSSGKDQSHTMVSDGKNVNVKSEKTATSTKERSETTSIDQLRQQQQAITQDQSNKSTTVATTNQQRQVVQAGAQPGDVTTEEIRHFDGGREIIWKTTRADGTMKVESKIIYDTEEVEVQESVETKIEKGSKTSQQQQQQQQQQLQQLQQKNQSTEKNQTTTQQQQVQKQQQHQTQQSKQTSNTKSVQEQRKQSTHTTVVEEQTRSTQQASQTTVIQGQQQQQQQQTKEQTTSTQVSQQQQQHQQQQQRQLAKDQLTKTQLTTQTIRTEIAGTTTEPNGDVTTEEVRYFQGGREHIWRTSRADGSSAMRSKTFYDAVEIPCDPEEVEETEEYEETTTTETGIGSQDKKKLPPAPASKPIAPPRQKNVKTQNNQGK